MTHYELFHQLISHSTVHTIRYGIFDYGGLFVWVYSTDADLLRSYIEPLVDLKARTRISASDAMTQYICFDVIDEEMKLLVKLVGDHIHIVNI